MSGVTKVGAGEKIRADLGSKTVDFTVEPSCQGKAGSWYCVTHGRTFRNQMEKDGHIRDGDHQLAWICPEHGIEVP